MKPSTAIVPTTKQSLVPPSFKDAVRNRTQLDDETLASFIEGAVLTLKMCAPLVEEMQRRFQNLDRTKQKNGTYKTIRGCSSFKEYCATVLNRTEQAVYKMLRENESKPKTDKPKTEKPAKEYATLVDAIPPIRHGKEITPPSQYSAADVVETAVRLVDNLVNQRQLTAADKKTVYRSIIREFQEILTEMES